MPNETLTSDVAGNLTGSHELDISGEEFCLAFHNVLSLQRHATAVAMDMQPRQLSAGSLAEAVPAGRAPNFLLEVRKIVGSDQMRNHIEQCVANGNYPAILDDEYLRTYINELASSVFAGSLVDGLLEAGVIPRSREYRDLLIQTNHDFRGLIDSSFGREVGFTRSQLATIIGEAYGVGYGNEKSAQLARKLEVGITAEIATKRYIEQLGTALGIAIRYSTPEEDAKKIDVVCSHGKKTLGIDIKSSDKNSGHDDDARAHHSPIEIYAIDEYRVRELYPAKETAFGESFDIKAEAYKRVIDSLLREFAALN